MSEKLKQIWSGFEAKTERRLTGRGVENIAAPSRHQASDPLSAQLPADYQAPAEAAFSALRAQLAAAEKGASRSKGRRPTAGYNGERAARGSKIEQAPDGVAEMLYGLAATEKRVERSAIDYRQFLAANADKKLKSLKKKKFLGLF